MNNLQKFPLMTYNYYTKRLGRVYVIMLELFENGQKVYESAAVAIRPTTDKELADILTVKLNDVCFACGDHVALHCGDKIEDSRRAA